MANRQIAVRLKAEVNDFNRQMAQAGKSSEKFAADFDKNGQKIQTTSGRLVRSAEVNRAEWQTAGASLTAFGLAGAAALTLTAKAAIDWESAWTGVLKTVDGTASELNALEGSLRGMALELPSSAEKIANVAASAGQLGVKVDGIESFTRTMIDLGETTNLSADEAATALARMANIFGTSIEDVSRMGATIVDLGNNSATTEAEIVGLATRLAAAGKQAGLSEANVLAFASTLTSVGVEAEAGGTALSKVFTSIGDATRDGGDKLTTFAKVAGVSTSDFRAAFEDDAAGAISMFIEGMGKLAESGQSTTQVFDDLELTDQRLARAILSTASAGDLLNNQLQIGNSAWKENTALVEEANKRYDTTEAKLQIAKNAINDAAITIGEDFLPVLADMASAVAGAAEAFSKIPDPIRKAGTGLGVVATSAALLGGALLLVVPRIYDTVMAFQKLKAVSPGAASGITKVSKAAGLATVAIAVMIASAGIPKWGTEASEGAGATTQALIDLAGGADVADTSLGKMLERGGFKDWFTGNDVNSVERAFAVLKTPGVSEAVDNVVSSVLTLGQATSTNRTQAEEFFKGLDQGLASLVASGSADTAEAALAQLGYTFEELEGLLPGYADALANVSNEKQLATDSTVELTAAQEQEAQASEAAADALMKWLKAVSDASTGFSTLGSTYQSVVDGNIEAAQEQADKINAANQKRAESDKETSTAATKAWEDYYDGQTVSADEYIQSLQDQVDAQLNWQTNLTAISERVRDRLSADMQDAGKEMIDELYGLGPEGAAQVALIASLSEPEFRKVVDLYGQQGAAAAAEFAMGLDTALTPEVSIRVNTDAGDATYLRWLDGLPHDVIVDVKPRFFDPTYADGGAPSPSAQYGRGSGSIPKNARGGIATGPRVGIWGEAGDEALVPLDRPLNRVDPSVRALSAFAQGLPQYASGGVFAPSSGPSIVTVPVTSRVEQNSPINIGTLVSHDVNSFRREAQLQHRRRAGGGRRG